MADPQHDSARVAAGADPDAGQRLGAYEVLRTLARGGMATVYAVRDTRTGAEVALKLLHALTVQQDDVRSRFRREFQALQRLNHPNVLRVFESGVHGERPWFTMQLLQGHDLRHEAERLRSVAPAERWERVRAILRQVARALAYVHDRGLVHRDVTPGNVMVDPDGHAWLMDFGVVKEDGTDLTAVGELVGTVAYMAPEQIEGKELDARTDLYALGLVLYLLLTGKKPFHAHTLHGFMDKHLHEAPRPPHEHDPDVPRDLEGVCLRLLEKDPAARYASASHVLHVLGERDDQAVETDRWPPRTVGRTPVRARLHEGLDRIQKRQAGGAYLLLGPQGAGKTRLIQLAGTLAAARGVPMALGRCRADDRPFGAFAGILEALPRDGRAPVLDQLYAAQTSGTLERYPVITAFRELIARAAPIVVAIDDLERMDPASLELVVHLARTLIERDGAPVVLVMGLESPGTRIRGRLDESPVMQTLELEPLAAAETEELVLSVVRPGEAATALAKRLHDEARGAPSMLMDLIDGLIDDGRIVATADGGFELAVDAAEITTSGLPMPASLRRSLEERLAPLSPDALTVGRTLAAYRTWIPVEVVLAASGIDEGRAVAGLEELVDSRIAEERTVGETDLVGPSQTRYRDVLLETLRAEALSALHQRAGEALEAHHRRNPSSVLAELAWHFERAGLAAKACAYLLRTAQQHLNRSGYEECLAFTERALDLEPNGRPQLVLDDADHQLAEIHLARAQAFFNLGQTEAALETLRVAESVVRRSGDPRLSSRVKYQLGVQLRNLGNNEEAEPYLRRALEQAEQAGDQTLLPGPLYELGGVDWARGDLATAERHWKESLAIATRIGDLRAQGHGYNGLGILALCQGQAMEARRQMERSAEIFGELGMLGPLVISLTNLVEICLNTGSIKKALQLAEQAVERCSEANQVRGLALSLAWRAQVLLTLNALDHAMDDALESLRLVRQIGAREDEVLSLCVRTRIHFARGDALDALHAIQELLPLLEHHDHEGIAPQVTAWHARALAALGRRPAATAVLQTRRDVDAAWPHVRIRSQIALGRAMALMGRGPEARDAFAAALQGAEAAGFRYFQLLAHHELANLEPDESTRARHDRVAKATARSLAASLTREHAESFLARGWGLPEPTG